MNAIEDNLENNFELLCIVCGDQATGRHYGTIACNGCKGFFRRTIRRSYKYTCRFSNSCNIDKHNRAVCRACRFMRCINAGMKVDAVQNQRDIIGSRQRLTSLLTVKSASTVIVPDSVIKNNQEKSSFYKQALRSSVDNEFSIQSSSLSQKLNSWDNPKSLLESLLVSENKIKNLRETVIKQTGSVKYTLKKECPKNMDDGKRKATVNDIFLSIHSQLLLVIEWAKTLPPFAVLSSADQAALLRNFAGQHVILCVAYRSKNNSDFLKLINDSCIPRFHEMENTEFPENFYLRDCERVLDELVEPMRFLKVDDIEFVAMKACVLFNPVAKGLSKNTVMHVLSTRRKIFNALESYLVNQIPQDPNRLGDLTFFILSPLQSLAKMISEDILVSKLSGVAHIGKLMEELILADSDEQKLPHRLQNGFYGTKFDHINLNTSLGEFSPGECSIDASSTVADVDIPRPSEKLIGCTFNDNNVDALVAVSSPSLMPPYLSPINSSERSSPNFDPLSASGYSPFYSVWNRGTSPNLLDIDAFLVS